MSTDLHAATIASVDKHQPESVAAAVFSCADLIFVRPNAEFEKTKHHAATPIKQVPYKSYPNPSSRCWLSSTPSSGKTRLSEFWQEHVKKSFKTQKNRI